MAKLLYWTTRGNGAVGEVEVITRSALDAARQLNETGKYGDATDGAIGHGVTIVYNNGRKREVK